jgi:hypothetical protein
MRLVREDMTEFVTILPTVYRGKGSNSGSKTNFTDLGTDVTMIISRNFIAKMLSKSKQKHYFLLFVEEFITCFGWAKFTPQTDSGLRITD